MPNDLHLLPKVRDSWSYLYVERCRVDQDGKAIAIHAREPEPPMTAPRIDIVCPSHTR